MKTKYKILAIIVLGITFVSTGFGVLYLSPGLHPDPRLPNAEELEPQYNAKPDMVYDGPTDIPSANNNFAMNFYSQVSEKDSNIFFSPTSVFLAFALAYEGAQGETATELQQVFGFEPDHKKRNTAFSQMMSRYNQPNEYYKLDVANALWLADRFEPKKQYIDTAISSYNSTVESVDFVTNDGVNRINEWVKEKTKDKIQEILAPDSTDDMTAMAITNAMYFYGKWSSQFNPDNTAEEQFRIDNNNSVKTQMMKIGADTFNYAETDSVHILELGYAGGKQSMLVILPKEIDGIRSVEKHLDAQFFEDLKGQMSVQPLTVHMPKFEFETKYELIPHLKSMGVKLAFDDMQSDFAGITDRQIFIDQAVHKTYIGVDEKGTEAAAVTALVFQFTSGPPEPRHEFIADHPFVFVIQDNETGQILFMGRVMDPTQ